MQSKVLVIGIDGGTLDVIRPHLGVLPNLARFFQEGVSGSLRSVPNRNSAPAWSSMITGKNPGKHGIFWFTEPKENSYEVCYVNGSFRKEAAVWDILSAAGKRVGVINVPLTYPAGEVNGFLVAGIDTPMIGAERFTYPPSLSVEIQEQVGEYIVEPGTPSSLKAGRYEEAVERLYKTVDQRAAAAKHLMTTKEWDFFMVVFTATDSAQHFFWKYMYPEYYPPAQLSPEPASVPITGSIAKLCMKDNDFSVQVQN